MWFVLKYHAKNLFLIILMISLWVLLFFGWSQRVALADWWRLRDYTPSAEIAALADATAMNDLGRKYFYVYDPRLEPADAFNQNCRISEFTIVLGCYVSGTGIYIYNVDDPRLDGVEEVTAAHEMLHVAYERLSSEEKKRIDKLTQETFDNNTDERLRNNVEQYREVDPSVVPNELHSILGTEVRDLPTELEAYYTKYFDDRSKVVTLAENYERAFAARQNEIDTLKRQLESTRNAINNRTNELNGENDALAAEFAALQRDRGNVSPEQFNQRADAYNARVDAYNAAARQLSREIDTFNRLVEQYNQTVLESQDLFNAIDSRPAQL